MIMLRLKRYRSIPLRVNYSTLNSRLKPWEEIPGPKSYPIIKQAYLFLPGIDKFHNRKPLELAKYYHENFGPIVRMEGIMGLKPFIMLFDPDAFADVLRKENSTPIRGGFDTLEYFRKHYNTSRDEEETRPTGLLTDQGSNWRSLRTTVNPVLLQPKTIKLYDKALHEIAEDMIKKIKSIKNERNMIDNFFDEFTKWSLESISSVALGERIGCLDPSPSEKALQIIKCVTDLLKLGAKLDIGPKLWKYYPTKTFRTKMEIHQNCEVLCKYFIDRARKNFKLTGRNEDEKGVLEKLLEIDERIALIMASEMMIAGIDTTATALMAALYLLGANIDKQEKLRQEIKNNKDNKLYFNACLKETLRIMPVFSLNIREATVEHDILGYAIPKGVTIYCNHHYVSMLEEQYPKPKEFIPERWLVKKNDPLYYGHAHNFATSPFGFGTRMCIGKRIAQLELEVMLSKILENFELEWSGPPPKVVMDKANHIHEPFNLVFKNLCK